MASKLHSKPVPWADRILVIQTSLVVVVAAAAIGGLADWAPAAIGAALALVIIPIVLCVRSHRPPRWLAFLPAILFAVYIGVALLNPSHLSVDGSWLPRAAWIPWLPTTVDRTCTLNGAWPLFYALVQGGAVAGGLHSRRALRALALTLAAVTAVFALAGAIGWFAGTTKLLGVLAVPGGQFFSTFVYKNHWSAFAILGASCAGGVAFSAWDRVHRDWTEANRHARVIRVFGFCAVILILITPALPVSRSGMVMATLLALIIVGMAFARVLRKSHETSIFIAAVLMVAVAAMWSVSLSQDSLDEGWRRSMQEWRLVEEKGEWNLRVYAAHDTWRMVKDRPWFGWGAGCFEPVFPLYQDNNLRDANGSPLGLWEHAHCDWLEALAEFGFVGFGLLLVLIAFCIRRLIRYGKIWSRWVLLGLAIIALYAVAEFPFHNPAVLIFWAVLLSAGAARIRGDQHVDTNIHPVECTRLSLLRQNHQSDNTGSNEKATADALKKAFLD